MARLIKLLSTHTQSWKDWLDWSKDQLANGHCPIPRSNRSSEWRKLGAWTARSIQIIYGKNPWLHWNELNPFDRCKYVAREFGISRDNNIPLPSGEGVMSIFRNYEGLDIASIEYAIGMSSPARDVSIIAHEIGHVFQIALLELIFPEHEHDHTKRTQNAEAFSWGFSQELLLPIAEIMSWTFASISAMGDHRYLSELPREGIPPNLRFGHLIGIARIKRVSIRLVIRALDRSPLLDETKTAIAVISFRTNIYRNTEPALRVVMAACPSWGYVIPNQHSLKQGFAFALTAYNSGHHFELFWEKESLWLSKKDSNGSKKWEKCNIQTQCEYAVVDVINEGRYIITLWNWDNSMSSDL